jgi:hypothetical protein
LRWHVAQGRTCRAAHRSRAAHPAGRRTDHRRGPEGQVDALGSSVRQELLGNSRPASRRRRGWELKRCRGADAVDRL